MTLFGFAGGFRAHVGEKLLRENLGDQSRALHFFLYSNLASIQLSTIKNPFFFSLLWFCAPLYLWLFTDLCGVDQSVDKLLGCCMGNLDKIEL
ncbi:hypothetical protein LWI28_004578 [Acer negundo]|uniref:Uncharacterized protein n=1 Tax=Acer negundo TaxID=4023 RepID=A0AAD5P4F9_ACENE|nr:hypothetical protein LWI28_004578 [Acer negundo]